MSQKISYITEDKKHSLEIELKELQSSKRKEILEALKTAKALGDLSENAEYHQAREDQARLESRIHEIEAILRSSEVVSSGAKGDIVTIGSEVTIKKEGGKEEKKYIIVGAEESDMALGKISNISPIGSSLLGKKEGDETYVQTPNGKISYKIIKVS